MMEVMGFFAGLAGIGAAFWLLYRHDSSRVMLAVYGQKGGRRHG